MSNQNTHNRVKPRYIKNQSLTNSQSWSSRY